MQRRLLLAVLGVAAAAAVGTAVAGFVLADGYRPDDQDAVWRQWQLAAGVTFLATSAVAAVAALVRRAALVSACAAVATVAAAVSLLTFPLVAWDHLGLRSVTVGTDVSGYWTAAFDDEVVVVLVGGSEASPGEYAVALLAHLAAPFLGAAALVLATVGAARSEHRTPRHDVAVAPAPA